MEKSGFLTTRATGSWSGRKATRWSTGAVSVFYSLTISIFLKQPFSNAECLSGGTVGDVLRSQNDCVPQFVVWRSIAQVQPHEGVVRLALPRRRPTILLQTEPQNGSLYRSHHLALVQMYESWERDAGNCSVVVLRPQCAGLRS